MFKAPHLPINIPTNRGWFLRFIGKSYLSMAGWKTVGNFPDEKKLVVAVAPHTSNWDFVVGVAFMLALNLRIKFLGKDALFKWKLFDKMMRSIGGIPVNRSSSQGLVEKMVALFNSSDQLLLAIAPEGTRSKTSKWKTGFLQIANQADVVVVPICLDFSKKQVHVKPPMNISDDIEQELANVKACFPAHCAKIKQNA